MSGNAALDQQIAQAMIPRYNPMQAIQQMQRQPVQQVQNPVFGGAIPMNFGLPQASQLPAQYQSPLAQMLPIGYQPALFGGRPPPPSFYAPPVSEADSQPYMTGWNPSADSGHGGAD